MTDRTFDSDDMAARGRIGAHSRAARYDSREMTEAARRSMNQPDGDYWLKKVDPDGVLDEDERLKRAASAFRAHIARMTRASVLARKKRAR